MINNCVLVLIFLIKVYTLYDIKEKTYVDGETLNLYFPV